MLEEGQKSAADTPPRGPERLGRYELIARIGEGATAEVHLARRLGGMSLQQVVVVKKIHPHLVQQKEFIAALLEEFRVSALIKHPRVIDICDLGISRGTYFVAMEHLAGQTLGSLIARSAEREGKARPPANDPAPPRGLDVYATASIIADAAEGLQAAHALRSLSGRALDLVHRDVNPKNIVVLYDGSLKLVNFGLARARTHLKREPDEGGEDGRWPHDAGYASPEQIAGGPVDRRSDVFSLGVVLWEALALRRLFEAESGGGRDQAGWLRQLGRGAPPPPSVHRPAVPHELDRICQRALAVEPEERFQSAADMQVAIESFLRDAEFRCEAGAVARFMSEVFAVEREAQLRLMRRASQPEPSPTAGDDGKLRPRPDADQEKTEEADGWETASLRPVVQPIGPMIARGSHNIAKLTLPPSVPASKLTVPSFPRATSRTAAIGTGPLPESGEIGADADASPRPRGKGRTGRIESNAETSSGNKVRASGRALPLPAPRGDEGLAEPGPGEQDEDDGDFTVVEPEKSPRVFAEASPNPSQLAVPGAVRAREDTAGVPVVRAATEPRLAAKRARGLWLGAVVALGAAGLAVALLLAALGGAGLPKVVRRSNQGDSLAGAEAAARRERTSEPEVSPGPAREASDPVESAPARPSSPAAKTAAGAAPVSVPDPPPGSTSNPTSGSAPGSVPDSPPSSTSNPASGSASGSGAASLGRRKSRAESRPARHAGSSGGSRKTARRADTDANAPDLYREGSRLYSAGKLDEARRAFQAVLEASPGFPPAYRGLGLVQERAGQTARAIRSYQTYLRLAPSARDAEAIRARIKRLRR